MFNAKNILILLLLTTIKSAFATEPVKSELVVGTREQFRACLDSEDILNSRRKLIDEHLAANHATMKQIQDESAAIVEEQKQLISAGALQFDMFNRRVEEHNKLVKTANESAEKMKAEQDAYNEDMIDHNKRCATLVINIIDRQAVLSERKGKR
ncbi:hypothetical protein KI809_06180 [Geobacter pelophilus]|uniref:Uncharacterized protein n=1 Tax=Geoanaerobacter pelophilus TaxID=60036 RepID=A0AAW4KZ09_9BACT|nr:hypothetical protein [Geoanaerobacter pelophilus]MBT0663886.1 hypothetical protein [Geoanaerobacter pelophilus]